MNLIIRYFSAEGLPVTVAGMPTALTVPWTRAAYPWLGGVAFGAWNGHGVPQAWGPAPTAPAPMPASAVEPHGTVFNN